MFAYGGMLLMDQHHPSTICCMCGDVGFHDQLFLCTRCLARYQHSYCSNYYGEPEASGVCDWCLSEERGRDYKLHCRKMARKEARISVSGHEVKQEDEYAHDKKKNGGAMSSTRSNNRRYKLLKDVLC
ncbi:hypothetical protein AMTRI_Chr13g83560 [Amborella trichopoda]|uniref:PHD-type zinc finger plants domain-containing protein n=1 Tax=Amborella trichopoda TaxID=13333 RepID=W1NZI5_AMBTC|nr:uncharacterized protein LOC110006788 [Amborella trichopoda]ERN00764.1 hypothetical protein AMTR_s00106p00140610 [Amborella trichopoda]|eukprot:XP_020519575.1 uncharacterized protein LOC110006788 [Amborella trichopoda]